MSDRVYARSTRTRHNSICHEYTMQACSGPMQHKRRSDYPCSARCAEPSCNASKMNSCNAQMHVNQERHGTDTACARQQTYCRSKFDVLAQEEVVSYHVRRSKVTSWSRCQPPCYVSEVSGIVYVNCRDASRSDHEQQETDVASSQSEAGPQTSEPAVFEFGRYVSSIRLNIVKLHAFLIDWISDSFMLGDQRAVCNVGEFQMVW